MAELFDLQILVNSQQTFFLNQKIISTYSGRLKKIIKRETTGRIQIKNPSIHLDGFPGDAYGFELASRFCYNDGRIRVTVANVSLLHCCAIFLEMTDKVLPCNLLQQTETFLEGMFYWSWSDLLICLKSCDSFFPYADSSGLVDKLISSLMAKIARNSDINLIASPASSLSSPDTTASGFRLPCSTKTTPESNKPRSTSKEWWFDDLSILPPSIIEKIIKTFGDNYSLILTKFILHYLVTSIKTRGGGASVNSRSLYGGLADTAVYRVISAGKSAFNCRGLFWVLRVVSGFGVSKECRRELERLIGRMLDRAALDDLLVSGHDHGGVYDVNLVLRLVRAFVNGGDDDDVVAVKKKMKKVGRLIDKYLREISPDPNLKMSKFLGVAESLTDFARECFDGIYTAIDIYLESHPALSFEERSRLCRCLNYEKLSLEACKDLAKNPRIPPRIAVQALISQQTNETPTLRENQIIVLDNEESISEENQDMRMNLQRIQWRVVELEKVCKKMKDQMSRMMKGSIMTSRAHNRALPNRLC